MDHYSQITRRMLLLLCVCLPVLLSGCSRATDYIPSRSEINNVMFIRAVAVDLTPKGRVRLCIVPKALGGPTATERDEEVSFAEGDTLFEANRQFHSFMEKDIFWGHTEYIFIGEEAAKDNIIQYLDYFIRDHEIRLTAKVIVVRGGSALDLLIHTNSKKFYTWEKMQQILDDAKFLSYSDDIKLLKLINAFDCKLSSGFTPYVYISDHTLSGVEAVKDISLPGFAFFQGTNLAGYLEDEMGRGLNWLRGEVRSGYITVKDTEGNNVVLEIIDSQKKMISQYKEGKFFITFKIDFDTNVAELTGQDNVFTSDKIDFLKKQQEELVKKEVENVILLCQEYRTDLPKIGKALELKHPIIFQKGIEEKWQEEVFPHTPIEVVVNSEIKRSYNLDSPIGAETKRRKK